MHPPLRKRLSFYDGQREPVCAFFCVEVTRNLTFDINEGKVRARTFKKRCDDDGEGWSHGKSRMLSLCGYAQKRIMTL
jgi:hypothetical protein